MSTQERPPDCPRRAELVALVMGTLSAQRFEAVAEHLATCPGCQEDLRAAEEPSDPLLSALRELGAAGVGEALSDALGRPSRAAPERLGEYHLLEVLGRGGMGTVYRARHARLDRVVAVKVLSDSGDAAEALRRFRREARAAGRLRHPNVVQATDAGEAGGRHFLVMEYVHGANLAALVSRLGPLRVADACEVARLAAGALQHAHERGFVHRDVKPGNLMLSGRGEVKLLDLGLARPPRGLGDAASTASRVVLGTLDYMAPEQWDDPRSVDGRADLYGLGCTLYFLLTGRAPFPDALFPTALQKMKAHAEAAPPLAGLCADAPAALEALLGKLLAKSPADRFRSAADVARALGPLVEGADLAALGRAMADALPAAPSTALQPKPLTEARARRRGLLALAGMASLLLAAAVAVVALRREVPAPKDGGARVDAPLDRPLVPRWALVEAGRGDPAKAPPELVAVLGSRSNVLRRGLPADSVRFSADGRSLLTASEDGQIRFWDVESGRLRFMRHVEGGLLAVAGSADGQRLAYYRRGSEVSVMETATARHWFRLGNLKGTSPACALALRPDGRFLAFAREDGDVVVCDLPENPVVNFQPELRALQGHRRAVRQLAFSRDGKTLATVSPAERRILLWNADGSLRHRLDEHPPGDLGRADFAPDGRSLAVGCGDGTVKVWDTATGAHLRTLGRPDRGAGVEFVAYLADGRALVDRPRGGTVVRVWDADKGELLRAMPLEAAAEATGFAVSPDARRAAWCGRDGLRVWDLEERRECFPEAVTGHTSQVLCTAFSLDGRYVVSGGREGAVRLWDWATGRECDYAALDGPVRAVAFGRDATGPVLATGGQDGALRLWRLSEGKLRRLAEAAGEGALNAVAFAPDGKSVVAGGVGRTLRVHDVPSLRVRRVLSGHQGQVWSAAFDPPGRRVASGSSDGTIRVWGEGDEPAILTGHRAGVVSVCFLGEGRLVSASEGSVRLWGLGAKGATSQVLSEGVRPAAVVCASDGSLIASADGLDGCVRLWRHERFGEAPAVLPLLPAEQPAFFGLSISPDGRRLATANASGTVYVLDLSR